MQLPELKKEATEASEVNEMVIAIKRGVQQTRLLRSHSWAASLTCANSLVHYDTRETSG